MSVGKCLEKTSHERVLNYYLGIKVPSRIDFRSIHFVDLKEISFRTIQNAILVISCPPNGQGQAIQTFLTVVVQNYPF